MCGIAGFWSTSPLTDDAAEVLAAMTATLDHRGPDGVGQSFDRDNGLALGHTRLAINDLSVGGEQPLHSPDGQISMTVNGEFYDFKRHRPRLMALGDRFETRCDSELAIPMYQRFGLSFVEHLRGEFAFVLWDARREELILVRDRFGVRPLFFYTDSDTIVWGSEVKAVLEHPRVPRRLCPRAALNQLLQTMVPGTSAFEGVHALQPGHLMRVRRRDGHLEFETHRYWDLEFPDAGAYEGDDDEAGHVHAVRESLIDAIRLRLEADVPVGCYLSGGIDSCSILGLASGAQQSPVKAFTISFDHDAYDESAIAVEMAREVAADHEMIRVGADELYGDNFVRTVWHAERTFYNTLGVAKWCMSRRVNECGYKTVITGEGADELFGGYPGFKRDMFLHGLEAESETVRAQYEQALQRTNEVFKGAILAETPQTHPDWEALCGFTPSWLQPWIALLPEITPLLSDAAAKELGDYDPIAAVAAAIDPEQLRDRHPLDRAQYTWSKTMLEGQILNWGGDRVDMANSMESRPAFLDHHVAETATRVPPRLRIKGNVEKYVLREAVKGVLPKVLYEREKFAFMAPPAHTDPAKQRGLEALIGEYLRPERIEDAGLLDPGRVQSFLNRYRDDQDPVSLVRRDKLVNHMLCLHILHAQFVGDGVAAPTLATVT